MATTRPLRADAARNHARILDAARAVFAEAGREAQMDAVAERAGVGVGTLYRHFPTKEALAEALVLVQLEEHAEEMRIAAAEEPTAWAALERSVRRFAHVETADRAVKEFVRGGFVESPELAERRNELFARLTDLVRRAQREGTLRKDVAPGDLPLLFGGLSQSDWLSGERGAAAVDRYLTLVLDGLRAPARTKLPGRALTLDEVTEMFRDCAER